MERLPATTYTYWTLVWLLTDRGSIGNCFLSTYSLSELRSTRASCFMSVNQTFITCSQLVLYKSPLLSPSKVCWKFETQAKVAVGKELILQSSGIALGLSSVSWASNSIMSTKTCCLQLIAWYPRFYNKCTETVALYPGSSPEKQEGAVFWRRAWVQG